MNTRPALASLIFIATLAACSAIAPNQKTGSHTLRSAHGETHNSRRADRATLSENDALFGTISALDAAAFDAFNRCSSAEQLQKHARYFAPDVEFYHDNTENEWVMTRVLSYGHRGCN